MDEPMNGLDSEGVEDVRELFRKLKDEGKTILMATHSSEDIQNCDKVYEMKSGYLMSV